MKQARNKKQNFQMENEVSPTFATVFVLTLDLDTTCLLGVVSESLLSDSDDDEESDDDESEESETGCFQSMHAHKCSLIKTHLQFWLCASSIASAYQLALVSLLQASCCFVISMRERSSRKNGQVCQEEI